jgi:hypothetical protein
MAMGGYANVETELNSLGADGWEVIGVHETGNDPYLVLKRSLETGEGA